MLLFVALASCSKEPGGDASPSTVACVSPELTWDNWGEGFFRTWCTSCHGAEVTGDARYGAPVGVDFDTWDGVAAWKTAIGVRATGPDPTMPPVDAVPDNERGLLEEYLACGVEVPPVSEEPCDPGAVEPGSVTLTSAAEGDALCARADSVAGAVTITGGDLTLDCLCAIGGDLEIREGASAVALPALASIGGSLRVVDAHALTSVSAPGLTSIGGDLAIERVSGLWTLGFPDLDAVGGAVSIIDNGLVSLHLVDVDTIGGGLTASGNAALTELDLFNLTTLGGDLTVEDNPSLVALDAFLSLVTLEGGLRLASLPALESVNGFENLVTIAGPLTLSDLPAAWEMTGFASLATVDGDLTVSSTGIVQLASFASSTFLGGLRVEGNPALVELGAFHYVTRIGDALVVDSNPKLARLAALSRLDVVGGDFVITGNVTLPSDFAWGLHDQVGAEDVGGVVTIEGNAP